MRKVWSWLRAEAREEGERFAHGEPGFRLDPRANEPDFVSEEGRLRLAALATRGAMLREAVHCVRLLLREAPDDPEVLAPLLQDPHDGLVTETLEALGAWKVEAALPALLDLFRMYPTEHSWKAGHVVDPAGTDASAKRLWMVRFGHPAKRRARPEVFGALRRALEAITERTFEGPRDLEAWLDTRARAAGRKLRAA